MAHHDKIALGNAVGGRNLLDHDKRTERDGKTTEGRRSNKSIDASRTHLNRDLSARQMSASEAWEWACEYAQAHARGGRKMRDNAIVIAEDVITLPDNWHEVSGGADPMEFFERVALPFYRARYGVENEVSAVVHMDESRPHMHRKSVPIDKDGYTNHKGVYTRKDLQTMHDDLQAFADTQGYPGLHVKLPESERQERAGKYVGLREFQDAKDAARRAQNEALEARQEAARARRELADVRAQKDTLEAECEALRAENKALEADIQDARGALDRIVDGLVDVLDCWKVDMRARDYATGVLDGLDRLLADVHSWLERREQARAARDAAVVERRTGLLGRKVQRTVDTDRAMTAAVDKARQQVGGLAERMRDARRAADIRERPSRGRDAERDYGMER